MFYLNENQLRISSRD